MYDKNEKTPMIAGVFYLKLNQHIKNIRIVIKIGFEIAELLHPVF
jgi:hypothetical protein